MAIIKILFVIMVENEALIKFVKTLQNQSLVHENKYIQKYMNALWVICYLTVCNGNTVNNAWDCKIRGNKRGNNYLLIISYCLLTITQTMTIWSKKAQNILMLKITCKILKGMHLGFQNETQAIEKNTWKHANYKLNNVALALGKRFSKSSRWVMML